MEFKDYYATLGVAKAATAKEIKQSYRKLARKYHPDVNPGDKTAETRFKEINEAYEVLGDSGKRKKYDELGANWRLYEQAQQAGYGAPFGGAPFGGWNVHVDTGEGGYRPMTADEVQDLFGEQDVFSDFFKTFFGGAPGGAARARGGRAPRGRKGRDVEQEIALSLEDAFRGVTQRLSVKHDGHARTIDVRIPPGVRDGSRIRVVGEGEHGSGGAAAGDLYLRVRLQPHARFQPKGQDLYVRIAVPVTRAVLGGEAEVPTLTERSLRLKIPPLTQQGQTFRLRGHGMPEVGKPDARGDLYATVDVELPRQLTPAEREHYEALARLDKGGKKHSAA